MLDAGRRWRCGVKRPICLALAILSLATGLSADSVAARQHYLPSGAYTDVYALQYAARPGNERAFNRLITDHPQLTSLAAADGTNMLQWSLANNNQRAFQLLLRAGAKPDQPGSGGETVIHEAAAHRDSRWLKLLLKNGANPNVRNAKSGTVPLTRALMADRDKQFEMLLKAGANPNLSDSTGNTALHIAALINKPRHVYVLLTNHDAPADPFILNAQGQTFQRYLFMTQDRLLNNRIREGRQLVLEYLSIKDIPIEPGAPPHLKGT